MASGVFGDDAVASVIMRCTDLDRSVSWYGDVLGWTPIASGTDGDARFVSFLVGGLILSLWERLEGESLEQAGLHGTHVVVFVDDLAPVHDRLRHRGADPSQIIDGEHYEYFVIEDPDRNPIGVAMSRESAGLS